MGAAAGDEAITAHEHVLVICRETRVREGQTWTNIGNTLGSMRRFDEAVTAHQQAGDIYHHKP